MLFYHHFVCKTKNINKRSLKVLGYRYSAARHIPNFGGVKRMGGGRGFGKVLSCLVVVGILMSMMPAVVVESAPDRSTKDVLHNYEKGFTIF
jgi:hypothetical protein